jgi:hypothetical protein
MASISSITQQYAKQQQQMKQPQKGGALFDFLKPDNNNASPAVSSSGSSAENPKPAEPEIVKNTEEGKSMMDTIKEKLSFGSDTSSAPAPAPAPERR